MDWIILTPLTDPKPTAAQLAEKAELEALYAQKKAQIQPSDLTVCPLLGWHEAIALEEGEIDVGKYIANRFGLDWEEELDISLDSFFVQLEQEPDFTQADIDKTLALFKEEGDIPMPWAARLCSKPEWVEGPTVLFDRPGNVFYLPTSGIVHALKDKDNTLLLLSKEALQRL